MTDCSVVVNNKTTHSLTLVEKQVLQNLDSDDVSWSKEPNASIAAGDSDRAAANGVGLAKPKIHLIYRIECNAPDAKVTIILDSGGIAPWNGPSFECKLDDELTSQFWVDCSTGLNATLTVHEGIEP